MKRQKEQREVLVALWLAADGTELRGEGRYGQTKGRGDKCGTNVFLGGIGLCSSKFARWPICQFAAAPFGGEQREAHAKLVDDAVKDGMVKPGYGTPPRCEAPFLATLRPPPRPMRSGRTCSWYRASRASSLKTYRQRSVFMWALRCHIGLGGGDGAPSCAMGRQTCI